MSILKNGVLLFAILLLVRYSKEKRDLNMAGVCPYPTNFFTETIKQIRNNNPLIGVVAMRLDGLKILSEYPQARHKDYFGASFVKLVESAGARAVPVAEDLISSKFKLDHLLRSINGMVFPGGDGDLGESGYRYIAEAAVKYSREQAKKGILFPVLGICRGSQVILQIATPENVLEETDSLNLTLPLEFTKHAKSSLLFGKAHPNLLNIMATKPVTFNAHINSVTTKKFKSKKDLTDQFNILTTNVDRKGVEFISTFEDKTAPIFGLQWHPEKSLFIFNPALAVDHSMYAIVSAQYLANTFVGMARQNPNHFTTRYEEQNNLVFKYQPLYVGNITESPYEQIYLMEYILHTVANRKVNNRNNRRDRNTRHLLP